MGIRAKFIWIIGVASFLGTGVIGVASYNFSTRQAMNEAKSKGQIIFNYILASRNYFKDHQRALVMELVEEDRFYPELMSGFVMTRGTWDLFKKELKGYDFKQATLDPLYPANRADEQEVKIINIFRERSDLSRLEGIVERGGEKFHYMALPVRVDDKSCLRCHGDPAQAPKDQVEIYGKDHGYRWQLGDTVSAYMVYVSVEEALAEARRSALSLFLIGMGCLLVVLVSIWLFLDRSVVTPIQHLNRRAEEISLGKNLGEKVALGRKDEIGALSKAVERLRISMEKLLKMAAR
jgi:HAMP domain-containing protein